MTIRIGIWLAIGAVLLGPTPFHALAAEDMDPVLRAEEIVVETELLKPAEIYQNTPLETEILTADDLRTLPAIDAVEALQAIPGIRITSQVQGQRGAVRIDGIPPEFTELLVNGQRYAGETGEAIDLGDLLFANVERVEILRGPQALRYSPRAAGGVLNIITRDPPLPGWMASGLVAGGDQRQANGELNVGFGGPRIGGVLTYDFNQIGGFDSPRRGSDDPDDGLASPFGEGSLFRTHDLYGTLKTRLSDVIETRTRLGYRLRDEGLAIENGPVESRRENQRWLGSHETTLALGDSTRILNVVTASYDAQDSTVGRSFRLVDEFTRVELGLERIEILGSTVHVLTLGSDLSTNRIELEEGPFPASIENPDLRPTELDQRFYRAGIYAIWESEWADWLETHIGARYQMHESFKPSLLPQAAIMLKPWRWDEVRAVKLRLSFGQAVRYPALRELYQPPVPQSGGGYFLAGNEDLLPERAWAVRLGIETHPWSWVTASAVGFYSLTKDRIRAFDNGRTIRIGFGDPIPPDPFRCEVLGQVEWCSEQLNPKDRSVFENANLDDVESYGIEARIALRPHRIVDLQLGYTWNRTRVADSNVDISELPNSPRHVVNGRLRLTAPVIDTVLTARGQWRDRAIIERSGTGLLSFATDAQSNTSFEVDIRLLQPLERWLGRDIDLFADLRNVTNNRVIDSNVVRGRSFRIGIQARLP